MHDVALPPPELRQILSTSRLASLLQMPLKRLKRLAASVDTQYKPFVLVSERDGVTKHRAIDNPLPALKLVQRRIKTALLDRVEMPPELLGGIRDRSVQDNARLHVRRDQVVTLDLKDYFPRITNKMVADAFRSTFGCSRKVTWLLTRLTTYHGHLPQGAPTSTALANLAFVPANSDLRRICSQSGLRHSVWVDDLTVSGLHASRSLSPVIAILKRHHYRLARQKLHIKGQDERQEVTRFVTNRKVSLGRRRLSEFRREVIQACQPGGDRLRVAGQIAFAAATAPEQAAALRRLLERHERRTRTHRSTSRPPA